MAGIEQELALVPEQAGLSLPALGKLHEWVVTVDHKRLGVAAKLGGASQRSAWAFTLWGDPTVKLPAPRPPADGLPFADDEFDLAYCSSVIEHVPPSKREAFAGELRRVARGWFVQTPAYSFPIEPHSLLPGAHWLPVPARRIYWRLGAARSWEEIALLRRGELEALFGPARAERVGPLVKSWISIRPARA